MTLLGRAPREVYRVYDEEEFFAQALDDPFAAPAAERRDGPAGDGDARAGVVSSGTAARRLAGVGALTVAMAVTVAVLALGGSRDVRAGRRARTDLLADVRGGRPVRRTSREAVAWRPARSARAHMLAGSQHAHASPTASTAPATTPVQPVAAPSEVDPPTRVQVSEDQRQAAHASGAVEFGFERGAGAR